MNVYQKLNKAREMFHQSEIKKSGRNSFANYSYFELGDFIVPALKIFNQVGLTSVIRYEANLASMEIFNTEKPEESITITSPMSEAALKGCHPVQNLGAVETYVRRYLWVTALEIVEHDALDSSKPEEQTYEQFASEHLSKLESSAHRGMNVLKAAVAELPKNANTKKLLKENGDFLKAIAGGIDNG